MEKSSLTHHIVSWEPARVAKLDHCVDFIVRICNSGRPIFKWSPEPRKWFIALARFGYLRIFKGSDFESMPFFGEKVASLD